MEEKYIEKEELIVNEGIQRKKALILIQQWLTELEHGEEKN
ncbi:hypothetical protein ACOI1C_22550 [Bacillus sp. DJP31]